MKIGNSFDIYIISGVLVFASVICAQSTQGVSGVDYPNYHSIPKTSFKCSDQRYIPGFYADLETQCQIFHFCFQDRQESFLCPTGTIFNQAMLACDTWDTSNCSLAVMLYNVNSGPVLESAVRKLPMLMKLRNRSQGKSMPTSQSNIFEQISSLYEADADSTASDEELESSRLSGDSKEVLNSSVNDESRDESPGYSESLETDRVPEGLMEAEQNYQNAVVAEDENREGSESMNVELEGTDIDSFYDPVTGGYYMDYNPYQLRDSEQPPSEEFRSFYDYEHRQDEYETQFQDYDDSGLNVMAEPLPEDYDLDAAGQDETEADFSKRQLESAKRRRRPMYFVVEDDDEQDASPLKDSGDGVLGDEPALEFSTEQAAPDANEASTEVPSDVYETSENGEGPEVSEEVLRRLQFPQQRYTFPTRRPLTTDQFRELLMAELVQGREDDEIADEPQADSEADQETYNEESTENVLSFQGDDQNINLQDVTSDGAFELDSSAYDFDTEREESSVSDFSLYEDSDVPDGEQSEDETEGEETDDTLLIIPEESDASEYNPSSDDTDVEETEVEYVTEGYGYEEAVNQHPDAENLSDEGYNVDQYEDAYEYYRSRREYPEAYEEVEQSYRSPEYGYVGPDGQFIPQQIYEGGEYDPNVDYTDYSPEEAARLAYLSSLQNSDPYSYMQQRYQQSGYMDPVYGTEHGYYSDDFSRNPYAEAPQASDYYASDETSDYYSQADDSWIQRDRDQEYELENRLDVTDSPLPVDITEADLVTDVPLPLEVTQADLEDSDEALNSAESVEEENAEDFPDFAQEDQSGDQRDAYYVFDFDEDKEEKTNVDEANDSVLRLDDALLEPDDEPLDVNDYSEELKLQEILGSENLQTDDGSISNDNLTIYKDDDRMPSESLESERNEAQSLERLPSQTDNLKTDQSEGEASFNFNPVADTWSPYVTESSQADKPVTLSSAFERLAALNTVKTPQASAGMDYPTDTRFLNNMAYSESMDFGPYGYGAHMGQFNMNSMQPSNPTDSFSHRNGGNERGGRLSSIQQRLRSMKQGKFGVFKKYMSSMKGLND